jgi:hypothetical protein
VPFSMLLEAGNGSSTIPNKRAVVRVRGRVSPNAGAGLTPGKNLIITKVW